MTHYVIKLNIYEEVKQADIKLDWLRNLELGNLKRG